MIINIRGTSGSGKTTLVRNVLKHFTKVGAVKEEGRAQPVGYIYKSREGRQLAVVGHYETACGGCDTINGMDKIYEMVRNAAKAGMDVLFEGLLISAEVNRVVELSKAGFPLYVIALDTPLDVCLDSINIRRTTAYNERLERITAENLVLAEAGRKLLPIPEPKGDVNPKNTESKHKAVKTAMRRFEEAGLSTSWENRESAVEKILALTGVSKHGS